MILREFNMEHLIKKFQKKDLRLECIFESDIAISRCRTTSKGYQSPLSNFQDSLKKVSFMSGPVSQYFLQLKGMLQGFLTISLPLYTQVAVDIEGLPLEHIWPEMKGMIVEVNAWIVPFLEMFGVEKVNGLSLFSIRIGIPHDLCELVK